MKKVLVTGGNGFLGKEVVSQLRIAKFKLYIWNRDKDGSILDGASRRKVLDREEFQAVIHLAWSSISDKNYDRSPLNEEYAKETIQFRKEVIRRGIDFVSVGSVFEELPLNHENFYQKSKMKIAKSFSEDSFFKTIWVVPTYIFSFSKFRPRVIDAISKDPSIQIQNPNQYCDWIEVRDVAFALVVLLQQNQYGRINLSSGFELSVKQFTDKFREFSTLQGKVNDLDERLFEQPIIEIRENENQTCMKSSDFTSLFLTSP